jgi:hypothetical protein
LKAASTQKELENQKAFRWVYTQINGIQSIIIGDSKTGDENTSTSPILQISSIL